MLLAASFRKPTKGLSAPCEESNSATRGIKDNHSLRFRLPSSPSFWQSPRKFWKLICDRSRAVVFVRHCTVREMAANVVLAYTIDEDSHRSHGGPYRAIRRPMTLASSFHNTTDDNYGRPKYAAQVDHSAPRAGISTRTVHHAPIEKFLRTFKYRIP